MPSAAATYLKYANLQMAAEASLPAGFAGAIPKEFLTAGNNRASKFTDADQWTVVSHQEDTSTGFSGTLFRYEGASDPIRGLINGELVMSFRSTEFADDAARDNQETTATLPLPSICFD
jgi:hypothetical protein